MKIAFYIMLKALFVLDIFTFLSRVFCYVDEWLEKNPKVNFEI